MSGITKDVLIKEFSNNLKTGNASFFIGSGLSRAANYKGWKDVLKECATDIGLDVEKEENNLITLAEYYLKNNQRTKITETIKDFFADKKGSVQNTHKIIASLPISDIWTTNYDTLIERSFEESNITNTVITDDDSYCNIDRTAKIKIYKIHGTVENPKNCIIARSDYESFALNHDIVLSELKGEMCSKSFLFLGYSFSDTDIQHILTRIRLSFDENHPQRHFTIVEKVKREDCANDDEFNYKTNKQNHHVTDMQSYGINVLLIDDYKEIEEILIAIRKEVYKNNILISGCYEDNNILSENRIIPTAELIAKELIVNNYKILSGYGKNLGANIVAGAFEGCTKAGKKVKDFSENVLIFPFPYRQNNTESKKILYTELRKNMINLSRVLIIISGEKNGRNSSGTYEEFCLAKENNNLIIPIATTGGIARQVWDELKNDDKYKDNELFAKLDKEISSNEIVKIALELIKGWKYYGA